MLILYNVYLACQKSIPGFVCVRLTSDLFFLSRINKILQPTLCCYICSYMPLFLMLELKFRGRKENLNVLNFSQSNGNFRSCLKIVLFMGNVYSLTSLLFLFIFNFCIDFFFFYVDCSLPTFRLLVIHFL